MVSTVEHTMVSYSTSNQSLIYLHKHYSHTHTHTYIHTHTHTHLHTHAGKHTNNFFKFVDNTLPYLEFE